MSTVDVREAITEAHHAEWARVVAALTRRFGDLDIAKEAVAEAFATAVERWSADRVPNRGGWLTTTAAHKAIDRVRRESKRDAKQREARLLYGDDLPEPAGAVEDELASRIGCRPRRISPPVSAAYSPSSSSSSTRATWRPVPAPILSGPT